jgi:hypothetical protein
MTARKQPTKAVTADAGRPIPASIPLPDSSVRTRVWYQVYSRLARPTLDWVGVFGGLWALGLCDLLSKPMPDATRIITLAFVGALYGVRTAEKRMGVA